MNGYNLLYLLIPCWSLPCFKPYNSIHHIGVTRSTYPLNSFVRPLVITYRSLVLLRGPGPYRQVVFVVKTVPDRQQRHAYGECFSVNNIYRLVSQTIASMLVNIQLLSVAVSEDCSVFTNLRRSYEQRKLSLRTFRF